MTALASYLIAIMAIGWGGAGYVEEIPEEAKEPTPETFEATFYTARCDGCTGITYTGYDVRETIYTTEGRRIIAVDPNVLPLGSIVKITLEDGITFVAEALDVGGAIKDRRIDVLVETEEKARKLGRQTVSAKIIRRGFDNDANM